MADIEGMHRVIIETLHQIEFTESGETRDNVMQNMVTMLEQVHAAAVAKLAVFILEEAREASGQRRADLIESARATILDIDARFTSTLQSAVHHFVKKSGVPHPFGE